MANTSGRGFAGMDPQKQRDIASKGGRAAHQKGTAHEWNSEEAAAAGRKGGQASHRVRSGQTTSNMNQNQQDNLANEDTGMGITEE